ncbi:hypothetical protein IMG5_202490 [Ichthyophthirius multifiliis]|uniref:Transmembrane protein n=1 Tax=Ichthyophthirius multifiliis TaxID=5932 RepID=G0R645_ICHMU|nr:hypothetical protein IMG5_202490 [Ichthyophthirius multifiliis]EGR27068.1 hypothetical protein IMG5_202490 [Ichthyophthirius multifiliis]|eukprot:XP_004023952.1 hypothetical protein IMG5_202490 [Ichthyophthirius multifiliis]
MNKKVFSLKVRAGMLIILMVFFRFLMEKILNSKKCQNVYQKISELQILFRLIQKILLNCISTCLDLVKIRKSFQQNFCFLFQISVVLFRMEQANWKKKAKTNNLRKD